MQLQASADKILACWKKFPAELSQPRAAHVLTSCSHKHWRKGKRHKENEYAESIGKDHDGIKLNRSGARLFLAGVSHTGEGKQRRSVACQRPDRSPARGD